MLGNLNDPKDEPYIKENLRDLIERSIPAAPQSPPKKPASDDAKALYRKQRKHLLGSVELVAT